MENQIKKFLEFNEKNIYFFSANGTWYIAIKPICDALSIDYSRQLRTLKSDTRLGQLWSLQTIVGADGRYREMVCLPENFIYGWIFKIQSISKDLEAYQWKCYELLYNYFHGTIIERPALLKVKTQTEIEIERLEAELQENPTYQKLQELKGKYKNVKKDLRSQDKQIVLTQLSLWETELAPVANTPELQNQPA